MDQTLNRLLLDLAIRHSILIERYKLGTIRDIVKFLNTIIEPKLLAEIQKEIPLKQLLPRMAKLVQTEYALLQTMFEKHLSDLTKAEATWQIKALKSQTPITWDFTAPSPDLLKKLVATTPSQGAFVKDWFDNLSRNTAFRVNAQIQQGMVEGEGIADIVRRIKGTQAAKYTDGILDVSRRELNIVVRTTISDIVHEVREETYLTNEDIVKGVMIVATLDPRTCEECMVEDGKVYDIDEGPRPAFHPQCRCTTVPVLKSWDELGVNLKEAPEGTRASMNGQVPSTMKYKDWLADQSNAIQEEALGIKKAEQFRAGNLKGLEFNPNEVNPVDVGRLKNL